MRRHPLREEAGHGGRQQEEGGRRRQGQAVGRIGRQEGQVAAAQGRETYRSASPPIEVAPEDTLRYVRQGASSHTTVAVKVCDGEPWNVTTSTSVPETTETVIVCGFTSVVTAQIAFFVQALRM